MSAWHGSNRRHRLPPGWPATVRRILERDHHICHICHQPGADQVDHVVAGDNHADTNLAAIHDNPCHRRKTASEGAAGRRAANARDPKPLINRAAEPHPGMRP